MLPPHLRRPAIDAFCRRHFWLLAAAVLLLAAFNLSFRLNQEFLEDWDEALYATSAMEMLHSGVWAATTFHGELDYYNSKPPLNVWLLAASVKLFGPSLHALRLPSAVCAWLTVLVLILAARHWFGSTVSLLAGVVLATSFGFLFVHAGRSANCDAAFTLIVLLTVVTLAAGRVWLPCLGPLIAAAFLLKGFGALLPMTIIAMTVVAAGSRAWTRSLALALVGAVVPIAWWALARMRIDGMAFFLAMYRNDFVSVTTTAMDGHVGGPLFYLNVLQKHQYDWLVVGLAAAAFGWGSWKTVWRHLRSDTSLRHERLLLFISWIAATLFIPTVMQTKIAWYLNPFYPAFAICVALAIGSVWRHVPGRASAMSVVVFSCLLVAETKALWYSYSNRDIERSVQSLLLVERSRLSGNAVYQAEWRHADRLVLEHLVGGNALTLPTPEPLRASRRTFVIAPPGSPPSALALIHCRAQVCLYEVRAQPTLASVELD